MNKAAALSVVDAKFVISGFDWYVPYYTRIVEQEAILSKAFLYKSARDLQSVERTLFTKQVNNQNL